ncbi:MAG: hypothetical protein ACM3NO_10510, partial [Deltaproteobacteria bacterium]
MLSRCRVLETSLSATLTVMGFALCLATRLSAADLQEDTTKAYDQYVASAEARMARERSAPGKFLYFENLPEAAQKQVWASLQRGDIWTSSLDALDDAG